MPRAKRAPVTTKPPAKPVTSTAAEKHNGNGNPVANDLETVIRVRAYELYEKRGRRDGHALDDWFQAESEVRSTSSRTA